MTILSEFINLHPQICLAKIFCYLDPFQTTLMQRLKEKFKRGKNEDPVKPMSTLRKKLKTQYSFSGDPFWSLWFVPPGFLRGMFLGIWIGRQLCGRLWLQVNVIKSWRTEGRAGTVTCKLLLTAHMCTYDVAGNPTQFPTKWPGQ